MPQVRELFPVIAAEAHTTVRFDAVVAQNGIQQLTRKETTTLQINVGKRCNQACHHCHVEAGPKRPEMMSAAVAEKTLDILRNSPAIRVVDITGGAPELNPNFRLLVIESRRLGLQAIDRCNLTVLFEPGLEDIASFLAENQVEITASLPCYTAENVERQRGGGVFEKSIRALRLLNELGYGRRGSPLRLNLVYNPLGAHLPPPQKTLAADYKDQLWRNYGIEFNDLFTITNMPIKRFANFLQQNGNYEGYMSLLVNHFNAATIDGLMCRSLVSVGWDGKLFDCDFNQMLELGMSWGGASIWDIDTFGGMAGRRIATGAHCFGCTAGAGSSCGGALQ